MALVPTNTIAQNEAQSDARLTALEAANGKPIEAAPAWTTVTSAPGSVVSKLTIPDGSIPSLSNSQGRYVIGGSAGAWDIRLGTRPVQAGNDVVIVTAGGRTLRVPIFVLSKPRLGCGPSHGARVMAPVAANKPSTGFVMMEAFGELRAYGSTVHGLWLGGSVPAAASYSFILEVDQTGLLNIIGVNTGGGFADFKSKVSISTIFGGPFNRVLGLRGYLNGTTTTELGCPGNTARFEYSIDGGATWLKLGDDQGVGTFTLSSAPNGRFFAGSMGPDDDGYVFNGALHSVRAVTSGGRVMYNADFTTLATGSVGPLIDTAPTVNSWAINGPICVDTYIRSAKTITPKLTRNSTFKVKGMELTPRVYDSGNNGWGPSLARYDSANFEERITRAKALGCNALKFASTGDPVYDNYPPVAQQEVALADYFRLLQKHDMLHYHNIAHCAEVANPDGSGVVEKVASLVRHMKLVMKYGADRIVGIDLCNESYFGGVPRTWGGNSDTLGAGSIPSGSRPNTQMQADLAYLAQEIRKAAPEIPISLSSYLDGSRGANMQIDGLIKFQAALGLDFHDYHAYNGLNNNTSIDPGGVPTDAQLPNLANQKWYLGRMLNGECGIRTENSDAAKTAWVRGMASQAGFQTSLGGFYFGDEDYKSNSEIGRYGMFNDASPALRVAMAAWPNP